MRLDVEQLLKLGVPYRYNAEARADQWPPKALDVHPRAHLCERSDQYPRLSGSFFGMRSSTSRRGAVGAFYGKIRV